jgi:hypothetical protein
MCNMWFRRVYVAVNWLDSVLTKETVLSKKEYLYKAYKEKDDRDLDKLPKKLKRYIQKAFRRKNKVRLQKEE